jgi:hypothetical protein
MKALVLLMVLGMILSMVYIPDFAYAQQSWFFPYIDVRAKYDDNIFLAVEDEEEDDWILTISPGIVIEPELRSRHSLICNYQADLRYFQDHTDEDSDNHELNADMELNFNKWRVNLSNMFRHFKDRDSLSREDVGESPTTEDFYYSYGRDRLGTDDISRIKRTQDYINGLLTLEFNKMDIILRSSYGFEDYHSDERIGDFKGQALTYKDLERDTYEEEVEIGLKLWPKTALLFSGIYGSVEHDTGIKSDSDFSDILVGLRGKPTAKIAVELKAGYRDQEYKDYDDDFEDLIFNGSVLYELSAKDVVRMNVLRTTNDTIYKENAYYGATYVILGFIHDFTERFSGNLDFAYEVDKYPTTTTEAGVTAKRKDDFLSAGLGLSYKLVERIALDIQYEYRERDCNFDILDYENNRISFGVRASF